MPVLTQSRYQPARGGHAPGDIREAFLDALLADELPATVEVRGRQMPLAQLCGLLWNCTDTLPGNCVGIIRDIIRDYERPIGSYAHAARAVKEVL
ncbi:MAG TPA: hypothetical protein VGF29_00790 [Hyphomicrobiaceae bacterium]|jgi:hypothetical protein